jgi:2-succinyl-6-hydroxy-2,4-cyclohexadiene-1-carboxylate synthase
VSLVFLHGFSGHPQSFEPVACFLPSAMQQAVCEPIFGHRGHAEAEDKIATFDQEVDRLAARLAARSDADLTFVGYSLGARLALALLIRHPTLAARAVLVGVNPGLADEAERDARHAADERWAQLLEREGIEPFVDAWQAQPIFDSQRSLPRAILDQQRALRLTHHPLGLARALRVLGLAAMPDLTGALSQLRVPIVVAHGEEDSKFAALSARMASLLPNARRVAIPGAGHNPLLEQPRAVAALLSPDGAAYAQR